MSLEAAIARNRARQTAKRAGEHTAQRDDGMRAFTVNVAVIPTAAQIALGLAKPYRVGDMIPTEKRTIYGHSLKDAKERAGIE